MFQNDYDSYVSKTQYIRDRVQGVAAGWSTGLYLWGDGGIGKSRIVMDRPEQLNHPYVLTNTRITARGLFDLLAGRSEAVHLIEDVEGLPKEAAASSLLRAALWSAEEGPRQISWITANEIRRAEFRGGIIFTSNRPLDDRPELRAVRSRIAHVHFKPTNAEIRAVGEKIAEGGYDHNGFRLDADGCREVLEYTVARCDRLGKPYDLRAVICAWQDRLQFEAGHALLDWRDLVDSRLAENVMKPARTRADRLATERSIAEEIEARPIPASDKHRLWKDRTGRGRSAYYDRLKEVGKPDVVVPALAHV